ncbi:MAG: DUF3568 domain-containing protein [Candidatus Omnitrophica bacterium]|nr:DUF3568 domain-containing protein [Candidatus Omnitrophota bacterium]MBU4479720.1 DUF3568 domain-containing protein [Candidatus Omnitrophota bacterium]MCG2703223.1 DUF3568 domain-containing protein [Candidatus Omnitrophota bacterium]
MRRHLRNILVLGLCVSLLSGCAAVIAGAGGTALWQHGKIVSEEPKSLAQAKAAAKEALKAKKITVKDEVARDNFVQLRGEDKDKNRVAVDIMETGKEATRIEVRVGVGLRAPAKELLLEIKKHLYKESKFKLF